MSLEEIALRPALDPSDRLAEALRAIAQGRRLALFALAAVEQDDPVDAAGKVLDVGVNAGHAAVLAEADAVAAVQNHVPPQSEMRAVLSRRQRRAAAGRTFHDTAAATRAAGRGCRPGP